MKNSTKIFLSAVALGAASVGAYYAVKKFFPASEVTEELKEIIETATETAAETVTEVTQA